MLWKSHPRSKSSNQSCQNPKGKATRQRTTFRRTAAAAQVRTRLEATRQRLFSSGLIEFDQLVWRGQSLAAKRRPTDATSLS